MTSQIMQEEDLKKPEENIVSIIGVGSKFKVGGLDFKTWILTIICVKIYVKCMHPLLKSGGAEAPPAPPTATPLVCRHSDRIMQ